MGITAPLISLPASLANQTMRLAIEDGWIHLEKSELGIALRLAGVSIVPGRIALARSPASLFSRAAVLISETIAALDALYAPTAGPGSSAARLPIATRRPSPVWRRGGMVARKMWNTEFKLSSCIR